MKHTPGPWTLEREIVADAGRCSNRIGSQIMNTQGWDVGQFFDTEWDGHSPNGRLIAAAPELLRILEEMTYRYATCEKMYFEAIGSNETPEGNGTIYKAREIIAKAKGE